MLPPGAIFESRYTKIHWQTPLGSLQHSPRLPAGLQGSALRQGREERVGEASWGKEAKGMGSVPPLLFFHNLTTGSICCLDAMFVVLMWKCVISATLTNSKVARAEVGKLHKLRMHAEPWVSEYGMLKNYKYQFNFIQVIKMFSVHFFETEWRVCNSVRLHKTHKVSWRKHFL